MSSGKGFSPYAKRADEAKIFPRFVYDEEKADPDFAQLIKTAIDSFSFFELPKDKQSLLKKARKQGYKDIYEKLCRQRLTPQGNYEFFRHSVFIGEAIFSKIPKDTLRKHIPHNDVEFFISGDGQKIIVYFWSLKQTRINGNIVYYSQLEPKVEINGGKYTVGFSKHAIERICERISPEWDIYRGLGDVFSYLDKYIDYEICTLRDGNLALTFWEGCENLLFWNGLYVYEVLGIENFNPRNGKPYFRIGYCPVVIEENFVIAKTLLYPGFTQTPEYESLMKASLPKNQKIKMLEKARNQDANILMQTKDFSCIKWFHDNGVPQVIQSKKELYAHRETFPKSVLDTFR